MARTEGEDGSRAAFSLNPIFLLPACPQGVRFGAFLRYFRREKRFIIRFYARSFGVLPGYARGIFSIIGKCNPILAGFAKHSVLDLKLKHFADI